MFAENFCVIAQSQAKIAQYKAEIQKLKGLVVCPNCSAEMKAGTLFCSTCGAKLPQPEAAEGEVVTDEACECCEEAAEADSCECCGEETNEGSCECCAEQKTEEVEVCTGTVEDPDTKGEG